jgi:RNA polymerase sigma-70 factor (TIGR02960 family)
LTDVETPREPRTDRSRALERARQGDSDAFSELVEPHLRELQVHCYRILGSVQDAEDILQETLLAAWRGLDRYEERASLRVWLYRIATNRCLNALRARGRRPKTHGGPAMVEPPEPTRLGEPLWLEPYPDALIEGTGDISRPPEARYEAAEATTLAFVTALQYLPSRQRCVLVLRDVLGLHAREVAAILDSSEASVKGALQRARATLRERLGDTPLEQSTLPPSKREREIVGRFAQAVEAGDIDGLVALLAHDAWLTMPPLPYQYQGHEAIARFLDDRARRRGANYLLVPTRANGQPAFGCYLPEPQGTVAQPAGLMVLTLDGDEVSAITWFGDRGVMPRFGLPETLDSSAPPP